jgi:hypothetical protein
LAHHFGNGPRPTEGIVVVNNDDPNQIHQADAHYAHNTRQADSTSDIPVATAYTGTGIKRKGGGNGNITQNSNIQRVRNKQDQLNALFESVRDIV